MNMRLAAVNGEALPESTGAASASDDADYLPKLCQYFEESEEGTCEARIKAERNRDYYDGKQLTEKEIAALKKRGQPPVVINYIKRKVEILRGIERRMRSDPKALPRNPDDEDGANAATDALRYVGDQNDFDVIRSMVYENFMIEGYGGCDVVVKKMPNADIQVTITFVPWDRLFYDPHSRKPDFEDACHKGIVIWMDKREAEEKWPDAKDAIQASLATATLSDTYEDRPKFGMWSDNRRTRVRIVQMHWKEKDQWMVATFTKGGFLEKPQVSPYKDKYGQPACSLVMRSSYIDRDNNRYGPVNDWIDTQDEINKRRSKALHLMNQRQTYGTKEAVADVAKAKQELARPDGHVELNGGAVFGQNFGVLPTGDMAAAQMSMLQQATAEMQSSGPNASLAGKDPHALSGRAIQSQQQAGQVEIEPGVDDLRQWTRDVYEAVWLRIKQFWTDEKWIRVTDDERNIKWVGLNKKITVGDRSQQIDPAQQQQFMQMAAQQFHMQPDDPALLQQQIGVENDVSGLDVDISIEEGPDVASLQSEQFQTLSDLAKSGIPIPPKAIVQASSIRNKDQILDEMEKGTQMPPQAQKQMQEQQQQLQQAQQQVQELTQKLNDRSQEFQLKGRELDIKQQEAQTRGAAASQPKPSDPGNPAKDQADLAKTSAEIDNIRANEHQTNVETALLIHSPEPEFKGTVSA